MTKKKGEKTEEEKAAEQRAADDAAEAQRIGREKRADEVLAAHREAAAAYERAGPFKHLKRPAETAKALTGKFSRVTVEVTYSGGQAGDLLVFPRAPTDSELENIRRGGHQTARDLVNDPTEVLGFVRAYDLMSDELEGMRRRVDELERQRSEARDWAAGRGAMGHPFFRMMF